MNQKRRQSFSSQFLLTLLFGVVTCLWAIPVYANDANQANDIDVGIMFKKTEDETPSSKDNTPGAEKEKPINKRVSLPNTGETVKQLSFLIGGMILIVIGFAIILDRQVKMSDTD